MKENLPEPVTSNLIAASAGTGKTYKLASRFISLLALGYPVEKLIALTFTRYAAGEFKGRILSALAEGAADPKGAAELTQRIRATLGSMAGGNVPLCPQACDTTELGQERYRKLLREMVDKLSRVNLATMDSFFTKLVSSHRYELGFPSLSQMDDAELEKVRRDALKSLLYEGDKTDENAEALMELCQDVSGPSKRDVLSILEENVKTYYSLYLDSREDSHVWDAPEIFALTEPHVMAEVREKAGWGYAELNRYRELLLIETEAEIDNLLNALESDGVKVNHHVKKGCKKLVEKLQKGDANISPTLCAWLYGEPRESAAEEKLRQMVKWVRDIVVLVPALRKTRGIHNLMKCYDERYRDEVRAAGKLVFDDMPRLVADKLMNVSSASSIAYRMDGALDHWMLDEFQDTAPGQWAALKPLLESIREEIYLDPAAEGKRAMRSLFVVGDEKQSIYGWRGATPELFSYLKRPDSPWSKVLGVTLQNESYRSAEAIMGESRHEGEMRLGFVNDLFAAILSGAPERREAFTRHRVAEAMRGNLGYVRVQRVCEDTEAGRKALEEMCVQMAAVLDEIRYGERQLSVAILTRSNTDVRKICRWFRENRRNMPIMPLADEEVGGASLLGKIFLHFFKWLQHPGDTYRESILRHSALNVISEKVAEDWRRWRDMLESEGYVRVLERLTECSEKAQGDRVFREWVNEARAFEAGGGSLDEWVRHIENVSTKANPPKSYIHVMTYHKSKGTEYDVVLLPFSSVKAVNANISLLKRTSDVGEISEIQGILVNPKVEDWLDQKNSKPSLSPYNAEIRRRKEALMDEALHVLYVAVTRAKSANYIFLNGYTGQGKKPHQDSYTDIFTRALSQLADAGILPPDEEGGDMPQRCEWGDPAWHANAKKKATGGAAAAAGQPLLAPPRPRRCKVSPSKMEGEPAFEGQMGADVRMLSGGDAAAFGTAVHALFEQVEWLGEGAEPGWMAAPRSEAERVVAAALRVPEVRALYGRQPGQVAYNEQNIDAIQGHNWVSGTLDRLVLTRQGGVVSEAAIIDFKTDIRRGATPEEQDAHLRESHLGQMQAYHSLISRAFDLPAGCVSVTLVSCPRDGAPARPVRYAAAELSS